ncbi:MAG: Trk system potassium transporter TrkA [Clostridia bacterium]|nr:Trk system potassium transporter TrkA [Clostridia bacterium]
MNIIIVGCGKVGQTLAEQLNEEGNNITVVDINAENLKETATKNDVLGVVGNGATYAIQKEAGIENADLLIAVTDSDELNLLCCTVAKKTGNCQTIARLRNPDYSTETDFLKDELGLAMVINPEHAAATEISRVLRFPSAIKIDTFAKGRVELVKFKLPQNSPLVGLTVREISTVLKCDVLICTVERGDDAYIAKGDFTFEQKDIISLVASPKKAAEFFEKINYKLNSVKDIIISGGGKITQYLCEILERSSISVKIIERDKHLCEYLCAQFPHMTIINGDYTDREILLEEGIGNAGAFAALTDQDEENILTSLFVKNITKGKLITKISRTDFDEIIKPLDLNSVITPKSITADMILRYVRSMKGSIGSNVETLYNIIRGKIEAAEFIISGESEITNVPLAELKFKENILIAAILRNNKVIIPRGQDKILPDDRVVVVSKQMALRDITDVLK